MYNNPLGGIDPLGFEIGYANHLVVNPYYHSKIIIRPENQSRWVDDPRFKDVGGVLTATIGAGPESGRLIYDYNRPTDFYFPARNYTPLTLPACYVDEDEAIDALFDFANQYNTSPVPYEAKPKADTPGYNSNSFISGLLQTGGFQIPSPGGWEVVVPGYQYPIPGQFFR